MRTLTKKQIELLCLIHPDFEALGYKEAAEKLGIGTPALRKRLRHIKERRPDIFEPLKRIRMDRDIYYIYPPTDPMKVLQYQPGMYDNEIRIKF